MSSFVQADCWVQLFQNILSPLQRCRIFCGGVKDITIRIISNNGLVGRNDLLNHISLVGLGVFSCISGLVGQISLVNLSSISSISGCIRHNGLIGLVRLIGLVSLGNFGIISSSASLDSAVLLANRLIGLVGLLALP